MTKKLKEEKITPKLCVLLIRFPRLFHGSNEHNFLDAYPLHLPYKLSKRPFGSLMKNL